MGNKSIEEQLRFLQNAFTEVPDLIGATFGKSPDGEVEIEARFRITYKADAPAMPTETPTDDPASP